MPPIDLALRAVRGRYASAASLPLSATLLLHPAMPRAIISPSVLASDFGQLTAECKRMIKGGAEWLHMGPYPDALPPPPIYSPRCLFAFSQM